MYIDDITRVIKSHNISDPVIKLVCFKKAPSEYNAPKVYDLFTDCCLKLGSTCSEMAFTLSDDINKKLYTSGIMATAKNGYINIDISADACLAFLKKVISDNTIYTCHDPANMREYLPCVFSYFMRTFKYTDRHYTQSDKKTAVLCSYMMYEQNLNHFEYFTEYIYNYYSSLVWSNVSYMAYMNIRCAIQIIRNETLLLKKTKKSVR